MLKSSSINGNNHEIYILEKGRDENPTRKVL